MAAGEKTHCRCGKALAEHAYKNDRCYDCYAEDWDRGFGASSQWAEELFGESEGDGEDRSAEGSGPAAD